MKRFSVALFALCVLLVPSALHVDQPAQAQQGALPPDEPGPYEIGVFRSRLVDRERDRAVSLISVFPSDDGRAVRPKGGPFPLLVFSHGFLLDGATYRSYADQLASHGFVVALPTYETGLSVDHRDLEADLLAVLAHYAEANAWPDHPLQGGIALDAIGLSGHSLGGKVSLMGASADARVRAVGVLDPVDGGGPPGTTASSPKYPSVAPERMGQIQAPLLLIGNDLGKRASTGFACAPEAENYQRFFETANPPALEVTQRDVGHNQYLDDEGGFGAVCPRGDTPSERVRAAARAYLTAFFLGHLGGEGTALDWLDARLAQDEAEGRVSVRRK